MNRKKVTCDAWQSAQLSKSQLSVKASPASLFRARRRRWGFPQGVFDRLCVPRFHLSTGPAQWVELKTQACTTRPPFVLSPHLRSSK